MAVGKLKTGSCGPLLGDIQPMAPKFNPIVLAAAKTFAKLAAALVVVEGLLVLVGWQTDVAQLKSLDRSFVAMNPVAAVLFAASGAVLATLLSRRASPRIRAAAKVAGLVVAAFGALKVATYLFPWNLGLDRLLFHDQVIASGNQIAPNTAFEFLLIGLGLSQIDVETSRGRHPAQGLALVALTLALFATFGYVYHAHALFGVGQNIPMSLPSALGFALVSAGILAAHPDCGAMATLSVDSAGGRMARRLLPAAVGIPALLGWLRVLGENARIYDTALGIALLVVLTIAFLTALVWYNAWWLNRNDLQRQQIELQFQDAKDAAEASARQARAIVEAAHDAFIAMDSDGRIVDWNRRAEALLGWSRREAVGRSLAETIIPFQFRAAHEEGLKKYLATGAGPLLNRRVQVPVQHRAGHEIPVELTIVPLSGGETTLFNAFLYDISERKQAEEHLQHAKETAEAASRAKSSFLANMSHEIRTPLNAVIGMTELVMATPLAVEQREYLRMVSEAGESLLGVINDILDFSKIEAGKLELERIAFSLRDSLGDTMRSLAFRAHTKGLELACHVQPELPDRLIADPLRLRQVIVNLVGNAVKFTTCGEVVLDVCREPRPGDGGSPPEDALVLKFSVRDTGIGIPSEKQASIFEAFEQADSSTTRQFGGTGLGLSISAKLVEMMGGRIWVESVEGRGSRFCFTLPVGVAPAEVARPEPAFTTLHELRVLIVDDNATNRLILEEIVRNWGMRPTLAASAEDALTEMRSATGARDPFPLVLTDANMPGTDGFALSASIQQHPELARSVIMMVSSSQRPGDINRCQELGISAFLMKPVKQSELFDAIMSVAGVAPEVESVVAQDAGSSRKLPPMRLLLAEDSLVNQKLAVALLEREGHTVVVANNGQEAIDLCANETFDAVLMDVQMPQVDGLEATAAIRAQERETGRHLPIIAMTAHVMKGDREQCLQAGMDDYLSKPVRSKEVFERLHKLFDAKQPEASPQSAEQTEANIAAQEVPEATVPRLLDATGTLGGLEFGSPEARELAEIFRVEAQGLSANIHEAIAAGDATRLRKAAHTLKGAIATLTTAAPFEVAQRLETMGGNGDLAGAEESSAQLDGLIEQLNRELRSLIDGQRR
jgi:PAS domain S-box-containing protein